MSPALTLSIAGVITGVTWIFVEIASAVKSNDGIQKNGPQDDSDWASDVRLVDVFHDSANTTEAK